MRIITGAYRGRKLFTPKDETVRPTTDRIKEDIFNILAPYVTQSLFLDLFSGTGQIALEAASRGATSVTMVDSSDESCALIRRNIALVKDAPVKLVKKRVKNFLIETRDKYDIIFMDPPYAFEGLNELLHTIVSRGLLNKGGIIVVETSSDNTLEECIGEFSVFRMKKHSATAVYFYRAEDI